MMHPTEWTGVCSSHFKPDCFEITARSIQELGLGYIEATNSIYLPPHFKITAFWNLFAKENESCIWEGENEVRKNLVRN